MKLSIFALLIIAAFPAFGRDPAQVREFRKTHACPATGKFSGACPGLVVDHKYPICAGGSDSPDNMVWQEVEASYIKDRLERELCALKKSCALN